MTNIGFVGLGIMGGPMASHLNDNGYNLSVFNRSKAARDTQASLA